MKDISPYRKYGKFRIFNPSEVVCMQGDSGDEMYIVLKGVFGVYINSFTDFPVRVAGINEGAFFGEMSVIDGWPRSATIVSEGLGSAISLKKDNMMELFANYPEIAAEILKTLSGRVASTTELVQKKGKKITKLPRALENSEPLNDPEANLDLMRMFAQRIRDLNDLLGVGNEKVKINMKLNSDTVILLPDWHIDSHEADQNDNSRLLAKWDYVCPYCGRGFRGRVPLFSKLTEEETTFDQRVIYSNFNMLFYTNIVCPNCNYTDTYQEFQKETKAHLRPKVEGNQFKNYEGFTGYADDICHTFQEVVLSYYQNLQCLKQIPNSFLRQAKAWHKLHWLYSDYDQEEAANKTAEEAINNYIYHQAQNEKKISVEDFMLINMIIAELYLTLGDNEKANEFYLKNTDIDDYKNHDLAQKSMKRIEDTGTDTETKTETETD